MDVVLETNEAMIPRRSHNKLARRFVGGLQRAADSVRKVHVSLKVDKGGKRGEDKVCQIQLYMANGGQIIIKQKAKRFADAMKRGTRRAKQLAMQEAKKKRRIRRELFPTPA